MGSGQQQCYVRNCLGNALVMLFEEIVPNPHVAHSGYDLAMVCETAFGILSVKYLSPQELPEKNLICICPTILNEYAVYVRGIGRWPLPTRR